MKRFLRDIYEMGRKNGGTLIIFELLYRVAASILVINLTDWMIRLSLKQQGFSYLTAENYTAFTFHPLTLVLLFLILLLLAFLVLLEVSAIFWCMQRSMMKEKVYVPDLIRSGFTCSLLFIRRHPIFWPIYMLGTMPFLGLHFISWEISNVKILEYTALQLYKMVPETWLLWLLGVLLVSGSVLLTFSLPHSIVENQSIRRSILLAASRIRRNFIPCIIGVVIMELLVLLITAAAYLLAILLLVLGMMLFVKPEYRVSGVLIYGRSARELIGLVSGSSGILMGLIAIGGNYFPGRGRMHMRRAMFRRRRYRTEGERRRLGLAITMLLLLAEFGGFFYVTMVRGNVYNAALEVFQVTAHRGGALMAPENTMSAMEYAVESMSDFAEIDVQETKDDVLILLHDTNLKRTTGFNADIWDMTYQEILQLDAGAGFNKRFLGERIPTLAEVMQYSSGKIRLNIEVKHNGHNKNIVSKVVKCIEDNNFAEQCVVTSMNYSFLKQVKELNPDIKTGYIITMAYGSIRDIAYADFFSVKHTYVSRRFVEEVHACGKEVHAWTVNYPGDIKRMISYGADGIITDDPALVHRIYLGEEDDKTGFWGLIQYAVK